MGKEMPYFSVSRVLIDVIAGPSNIVFFDAASERHRPDAGKRAT
jgi:hypothetical protein